MGAKGLSLPTSYMGESFWNYIRMFSSQPSRRVLKSWGHPKANNMLVCFCFFKKKLVPYGKKTRPFLDLYIKTHP